MVPAASAGGGGGGTGKPDIAFPRKLYLATRSLSHNAYELQTINDISQFQNSFTARPHDQLLSIYKPPLQVPVILMISELKGSGGSDHPFKIHLKTIPKSLGF